MSNMQNKRTLEFDVSDAPMLVHAMQIAANTAMMCGHPDARKRFQQYREVFQSFAPPEAAFFDEETWGEMGMALAQASAFHVYMDIDSFERREFTQRGYLSYSARNSMDLWVSFTRKDQEPIRFRSKYGFKGSKDDPRVEQVFKALAELAPLDCVGTFDNQDVVLDAA
jgi:hypothetical protein